jgi:hypothetical protein
MTAGPTNFFRTVLIAILIYFAYKAIVRIFKAVTKKPSPQNSSSHQEETIFDNSRKQGNNKRKGGGDSIGEYVDYEEV